MCEGTNSSALAALGSGPSKNCPRCGAGNGRHVGGCALAPAMYQTSEGIPVWREERCYLGDADEDGVPGIE